MPINQLSSANTFEHWLIATQLLIQNQNYVEDNVNFIIETASTIQNTAIEVSETANNFINTYNDTLNVYNSTVEVYNTIFDYVSTAYDTANAVLIISSNAYDTSNNAFDTANDAFELANLAVQTANTFFDNVFSIQETSSSNTFYPTFVDFTSGVPENVYINSSGLFYEPFTGNLFSTILSSQNVVTNNVVTNTVNASGLITSNEVSTGNITASGLVQAQDFNSTSDITLKENVIQIENPLSVIENLTGIKFNWKDTKEVSYGLSAQEVEQILPEIVKTRENGLKGVNYLNIIAILIESVKELKNEIENLKKHK